MEPSHAFMKARAVAFSCILITSLLWVLMLCLMAFFRWDISPSLERSLIVILLCTNSITVIMVPILLLLRFRVWLDIARLLLLLVLHIGSAAAFTYCSAYFTCDGQSLDQEGICRLINMYILMASWVIPLLLLTYAAGLFFMLYRRSQIASQNLLKEDEEASVSTPPMAHLRIHHQQDKELQGAVPVYGSEGTSLPPWLDPPNSEHRGSISSVRFSKPPQGWTYAM